MGAIPSAAVFRWCGCGPRSPAAPGCGRGPARPSGRNPGPGGISSRSRRGSRQARLPTSDPTATFRRRPSSAARAGQKHGERETPPPLSRAPSGGAEQEVLSSSLPRCPCAPPRGRRPGPAEPRGSEAPAAGGPWRVLTGVASVRGRLPGGLNELSHRYGCPSASTGTDLCLPLKS